jgi:hypothetical protein
MGTPEDVAAEKYFTPPQPDQDIEELAKDLWAIWIGLNSDSENFEIHWAQEGYKTKDKFRERAKGIIAKLRTPSWGKRSGDGDIAERIERVLRGNKVHALAGWLHEDSVGELTSKILSEIRAIERDAVERVAEIAAKTMICPPDEDNRNCVVDATKEMCVKCWTEYLESELLEQGKLSRICDKCKSRKELRVGSEQFPSEVCTNPKMYPNGEIKTLYIECSPSFTSCEYFGEQDKGG